MVEFARLHPTSEVAKDTEILLHLPKDQRAHGVTPLAFGDHRPADSFVDIQAAMTRTMEGKPVPVDRVLYAQASYDEYEIAACFRSPWRGPKLCGSGRMWPRWNAVSRPCSASNSVGLMCNSGASALLLAFALLDLPGGSEVITSPLTSSTDIGALYHLGLKPVLVDWSQTPSTPMSRVSRRW